MKARGDISVFPSDDPYNSGYIRFMAGDYFHFIGGISASDLVVGTVPLARLSGITSNQFDQGTKDQLALAGIVAVQITNTATATANGILTSNMFNTITIRPFMRANASRLPPMGKVYDSSHDTRTEAAYIRCVQGMHSLGLSDAGYKYVNFDIAWSNSRSNGVLVANTNNNNFPHGMAFLGAVARTNNCRLGLYVAPGDDGNQYVDYGGAGDQQQYTGWNTIETDAWAIVSYDAHWVKCDFSFVGGWNPEKYKTWLDRFCAALDDATVRQGMDEGVIVQCAMSMGLTDYGSWIAEGANVFLVSNGSGDSGNETWQHYTDRTTWPCTELALAITATSVGILS